MRFAAMTAQTVDRYSRRFDRISRGAMQLTVRVLGVGAAAPELRLQAADVGAAWGRGGRGEVAVCAPDEDTLTLGWQAAERALAAAGIEAGGRRRVVLGHEPSPVRRRPELRVPRGVPQPGADRRWDRSARARRTREWKHSPRRPTRSPPARRASRSSLRPTPCDPGPGTGFEARCGAGAAAIVLAIDDGTGTATIGTRVTRTRPFLDRYRGDGEIDNRDMYDARLFREEIFLPVVREVAENARRVRRARRGRSPTPTGASAPSLARNVKAATMPSNEVYGAIGDSGAAAALLGGIGALDAAGLVAIVGTGGGRTTGVLINAGRAGRGRRAGRRRAHRRPGGDLPRGAPRTRAVATRRRDDPDGRAARERDVRARRRRDARSARRPVRRLRHDQHAAVDPPALHQLRRAEARARRAGARAAGCTRSSSIKRCPRRSSRRSRSSCSTWTTARG